jgi:hypothetical protein
VSVPGAGGPPFLEGRQPLPSLPINALTKLDHGGVTRRLPSARELAGTRPTDEDSLSARLLADIRAVFTIKDAEKLFTAEIIDSLIEMEESPWGDYHGKAIGPHGSSRLLRAYTIKPHLIRIGEAVKRGYEASDFADA